MGKSIMATRLLIIGICILAVGCNSDPRCRRETALLRAEILDLEDKFYQTRAERDQALAALHADGKSELASKIERRSLPDRTAVYDNAIYGDVIYDAPAYEYETHGDWHSSPTDPAWNYQNGIVLPPGESQRFSAPHSTLPGESHEFDAPGAGSDSDEPSVLDDGSTGFIRRPVQGRSASFQRNASGAGLPAVRSRDQADQVTQLVIDRTATFVRYDGLRPVGITVLLKPLNARGQTELIGSDLAVSVLDPSADSVNQRLGVWTFLADEVELFLSHRAPQAAGILLDLPFDEGLPEGDEIVVAARYVTPNGRRLDASARVTMQNDDSFSASAEFDDRGGAGVAPEWRPVR